MKKKVIVAIHQHFCEMKSIEIGFNI